MKIRVDDARRWSPPWFEERASLWILGVPPGGPGVAVVGARASDPYGLQVAAWSAREAGALGRSVISGGAEGCDREAHLAALRSGGHTAVVLAGGLDRPYPAAHRTLFEDIVSSGGALITAYAPGTPPRPHRFLERNRLIAELSAAVIVARSRARSGAHTTARVALSLGRPVLAVPGPVGQALSQGPHGLLGRGALPMTGGRSLRHALGRTGGQDWPITNRLMDAPFEEPVGEKFVDSVTGTPEGEALLEVLIEHRMLDLAGFSRLTRLPIQVVTALLVELEIAGVVTERQGSYRLR